MTFYNDQMISYLHWKNIKSLFIKLLAKKIYNIISRMYYT